MDFRQVIFWQFDTAITDDVQRGLQLRVTRDSHDQYKGQGRGLWDTTRDYEVDDYVWTVASGVPTRWYCILANSGNSPAEGTYWTHADHFEWACDDPTKVLIIPGLKARLIGKPNPISAHPTKEQGKLTPESRELTLRDFFELTSEEGAVDGNGDPVAINWLSNEWKSFLNQLFDNDDGLTTWSFNQILDDTVTYAEYADVTKFHLYWMGDSKNEDNTTPEEHVYAEETETSLQVQQVRVTIDSLLSRSQTFKIRDFLDTTSDTDFDPKAFFGNYVVIEGQTVKDANHISLPVQDARGQPMAVDLAATTVNDHLHFGTYEEIIDRMIRVMGCTTDPTKWTSRMQPWTDRTNQTNRIVESLLIPCIADHTWMGTTGVCIEAEFSIDPRFDWTVQEASYPGGNSWDTDIATCLEKYATQWVTKIEYEYDQTTKQPIFFLRDIFEVATQITDAATASIGSGDTTISVTDAAALFAASKIIQVKDELNTEYMRATAGSGTTLTVDRPNPIAFSTGAIVSAIRSLPSTRSGNGPLQLKRSVKERQKVSAKHVELKAATDGDILCSPRISKKPPIQKEMAHRSKAFNPIGSNTVFKHPFHTYNASLTQDKQYSCWRMWTGGRNARCIIANDATITLTNNTAPHVNFYKVESTSTTFNYLRKYDGDVLNSWWDDPTTDIIFFSNGAFGVVYNDPTGTIADGFNSILVGVNQFQSINPPVSGGIGSFVTNELITVGFDGEFNNFNITDGSAVATIAGDLTGQSIIKNAWKGMQFLFPKYGIFTLADVSYSSGTSTCTFDHSFPATDTAAQAHAGGPQINPDWMIGAFFYYDNGNDKRYDPNLYSNTYSNQNYSIWKNYTNIKAPTIGYFFGAYMVSRLVYGLPDGTTNPASPVAPDDSHGCESYTAAQVYAEFSIGNPSQITRHYDGITGSDGLITSVKNGMMFYEQRETNSLQSLRFYHIIGRGIDEFSLGRGTSVLYCFEKRPQRSISRHKVRIKGRNTSGGSSTVGGASGVAGGGNSGASSTGTADLGGALLQHPNTPGRNTSVPAFDGIVAIEARQRVSTSTDDLFDAWAADTTTKLLGIDYHGNVYLRQGTLTLANGNNDNIDISTYASYLISGPSAAFAIRGLAKPLLGGTAAYRLSVTIVNTVAQTLTLKNNDAGSTAGNRLRIPGGDATVLQHESFTVEYDLTNSEWKVTNIGKAPVTDAVVTDPTTGQNSVRPITAGVVALDLAVKAGDTAHGINVRDNANTIQSYSDKDGNWTFNQTATIGNLVATFSTFNASASFMSGAVFNSTQIGSVADPTLAQDAATKNYVDGLAGNYVLRAPSSAAQSTISPSGDFDGLTVNHISGVSSGNLFNLKINGTTKVRVDSTGKFIGLNAALNTSGSTTTLELNSQSSNTSSINCSTVATGSTQVFTFHNGASNFFTLFGDKSAVFNDGSNMVVVPGAFAAQQIQQDARFSNANLTLTASGTNPIGSFATIVMDTSGGNRTLTLPAASACAGTMLRVIKGAAANTLSVQDSALIKAWTPNAEAHLFMAVPISGTPTYAWRII